MPSHIGAFSLIVADYDEAIKYYTQKLGFTLIQDTDLGGGKRWVLISPAKGNETRLLLAKAANEDQQLAMGNQTGGRVGFFLHTNDFEKDYQQMSSKGVKFLEAPRHEAYGTVVVFEDLYGNKWDLLQLKA